MASRAPSSSAAAKGKRPMPEGAAPTMKEKGRGKSDEADPQKFPSDIQRPVIADKNIKNSALKIPVFHVRSGQKVVIEEKIEGRSVQETAVTIQGLTSLGYLLATDEDNIIYELHPDGNSFDFFKGLVRRKLD